jgi:hypothetical protein
MIPIIHEITEQINKHSDDENLSDGVRYQTSDFK